ncbi:methyltransferase [Neptunitalea chrysea]|uniref:Methyltransferase n=1 Tax=Neptunitalea chrysea TaxID=1647581 RepID=A0A9W6B656_9FLAO|nr:class I SAM-dependent methyltransferase [Neptunitalea chrysea]GLB53246.1 methyltransferase [Neptunitalea chrysea]
MPPTENKSKKENWYSSWFNTPYYHILYKDRDDKEAKFFMDTLTNYLNLPEEASILDVACGKGRHSIYLNSIGYNVTGIDISEESIAHANKFENPMLHFEVHDMCQPYHKTFDAVFNLFTSFGYFKNEEDNLNALKAFKANLNETGFGVIDFLNIRKVIPNLTSNMQKTVEGITFHIHKYVEDGYIFKNIKFTAEGENFEFTERVKSLTLNDFEAYFEEADMYLLDVFGDYKLKKFDEKESDRMILIFK